MMVGVPGVGKSTWVREYARALRARACNLAAVVVLGTDTLIERMRVKGLARGRSTYAERWAQLMKLASPAFDVQLKLAVRRPRWARPPDPACSQCSSYI